MESQKIINLLNHNDIESQKFTTKRWYIINDQSYGKYINSGGGDNPTIKFDTKVIKPNLCDYSDAYILVIGDIENKAADAKLFFKNCAPFAKCIIDINDERVEEANNLDIIMPMYDLLEYSDNYELSSGSLYQFKRDKIPSNNPYISEDNSTYFKYKSELL